MNSFSDAVFLCDMLTIQCRRSCILYDFRLSKARMRTCKLDWIGEFRDSRAYLLMCLKYERE